MGDEIEIAAVAGHPGPLLHGWVSGSRMLVTMDGRRTGDVPSIDTAGLDALTTLAWQAREDLGATRLEWAIVDGRPVLLQLSPGAVPREDVASGAGTGRALARGLGVSEGRAVGPSRKLHAAGGMPSLSGREVLLVDRPTPEIAPLLWHVAALVSRSGNPGAHLFEVARSLHLPAAVVTSPISWSDGDVIAVDGGSGEVVAWAPEEPG